MQFKVIDLRTNAVNLLRRAGYRFQHHTDRGEMSFVRPLAPRGDFPRFHLYAQEIDGELSISIHLDAKRETHGQSARHQGEYGDDGALATEVARLKQILR